MGTQDWASGGTLCPEAAGPRLIDPAQVTIEDTGDICPEQTPTMFQALFQAHQKQQWPGLGWILPDLS